MANKPRVKVGKIVLETATKDRGLEHWPKTTMIQIIKEEKDARDHHKQDGHESLLG